MNHNDAHSALTGTLVLGALATLMATAPASARSVKPTRVADATGVTLILEEPLSSELNHPGDTFHLRVAATARLNGHVIRAGTVVTGVVTAARPSGRISRQGRLGIDLEAIAVGGEQIALRPVHALPDSREPKFESLLRQAASPLREIASNVIDGAGGRADAGFQTARFADGGQRPRLRDFGQALGDPDPLARVELGGKTATNLMQRGLAGLARVGTGYLNSIVNGPAGLLRRGTGIEVPAGTVLHAVTANAASNNRL